MIVLHQSEEAAMLTFTHGEDLLLSRQNKTRETNLLYELFTGVRHSMIDLFVKDLKTFTSI